MKRLLSGSLLVSLRVAASAAPAQTPFGQRQLRATGDPFAVARFPGDPGQLQRPGRARHKRGRMREAYQLLQSSAARGCAIVKPHPETLINQSGNGP